MPDWYTVQASAALENCKIVIRTPDPTRQNQSEYYFQLNPRFYDETTNTKLLNLGTEERVVFKRFFAKDYHPSGFGSSRLYNHILALPWGAFQPQLHIDTWYDYQPIPEHFWVFPTYWDFPKPGPFNHSAHLKDPNAVWGHNNPEVTHGHPDESIIIEEYDLEQHDPETALTVSLHQHVAAGTLTPDVISDIVGSLLSSNSENNSVSPPPTEEPRLGNLIPGHTPPSTNSSPIQPSQRRPVRVDSPSRPESDEWLQRPINHRPNFLLGTFGTEFDSTEIDSTSTPMERMDTLKRLLRDRGFDADASQHPIITIDTRGNNELHQPTFDAKTLTDIKVKTLGVLDAQINNLESAAIKNTNKQCDGRVPILLLGTTVQSPCPDLVLTPDLLKTLNDMAFSCMTKMSHKLIEKQLEVMETLVNKKEDLLSNWQPTEQDKVAAERITKSRTIKESTYTAKPIPDGVKTFQILETGGGHCFGPAKQTHTPRPQTPPQPHGGTRPKDNLRPPRARSNTDSRRHDNPQRESRYGNNERRDDRPPRPTRHNYDSDEEGNRVRFDRNRNTRYFNRSPN